MINASKNKSALRTKETLTESFFKLMETKRYNDISITDICDFSSITRMSFYRNFDSKYDLVIYKCQNIMEDLNKLCNFEQSTRSEILNVVIDFFYDHKDFFILLSENELMQTFGKVYIETINNNFSDNEKYDNMEEESYTNAFIAGGIFEVLNNWCKLQFKTSKDIVETACKTAFK